MNILTNKIDYTPRSKYIKNNSSSSTSTSVSSNNNNEVLDYINKMFVYDAVNQVIKANYSLYSVGEISAYGFGTGSTSGETSYNRLDLWADYSVDKAGYVLSAYLGNDLNSRLIALENNSTTTILFTNITGKPTTLSGYGITDALNINGVAASATKLANTRTIWGQNFDGSSNVSGDLNGVSSIIRNHPYAVDSDIYGNLNWKVDAESWFNWNVGGVLNVNKGGNVGIGIGTPTSKLHVIGEIKIESHNSNTGAINIQGNSTSCGFGFGNTESVNNMGFIKFKPTAVNSGSASNRIAFDIYGNDDIVSILGNGNVGIGTTSPSYKLDVNGTSRFRDTILSKNIIFNSDNTWGNLGSIRCTWGNDGGYPTLYGSSSERWIMHINPHISYVQNGVGEYTGAMNGATIRFAGNYGATTAWDLGVGCNSVGSDKFSIGRSTTSFVSLDNTGNFGIGTTSPSHKLDVNGDIRSNYVLFKNYNNSGLAGYVGRGSSSSNKIMLNGYAGNSVTLGSNGSDDDLCIHTSHNVSIGTGSDTGYKLYVEGMTKISGTLYTVGETLLEGGARIYSAAGAGLGISLFNEPSFNPNYGLMFAQTVYKGKHGAVNGDWATYFTMSPDAGRGWIFTNSASSSGGNVASISNTGNLTCSGEVTAYSSSDVRLKTNIKKIESAIDVINKLNPVTYNWNSLAKELNPLKTDNTEYGLIAQELEVVMPELVHEIYGKYKSIDYVKLSSNFDCRNERATKAN